MILEPCGNEDCDACYPLPRWEVEVLMIKRVAHRREIKVATAEDALRVYAEGTAWPDSYDERTLEVLRQSEPTASQVTDERRLEFHRMGTCWHRMKESP